MTAPPAPSMRAYGRQLFICQHGICAPPETAVALNATIRPQLGKYKKLRNPERIKNTLSECLGVCSGGPVVVVYPDGIWYHHVTEEVMTRIIDEHLIGGNPVEEYIFHRLYPAGQEPSYAPALRGDKGAYEESGEKREGSASDTDSQSPLTGEERRQAARRKRIKKGLTIVNTGEGKGKT
ncbi:MAG: hypothetical protein AAF490_16645, partial [Chloroflexota bacterium]